MDVGNGVERRWRNASLVPRRNERVDVLRVPYACVHVNIRSELGLSLNLRTTTKIQNNWMTFRKAFRTSRKKLGVCNSIFHHCEPSKPPFTKISFKLRPPL